MFVWLILLMLLIIHTTFAITDTIDTVNGMSTRKYPYTIDGVSYSVTLIYTISTQQCSFFVNVGDVDFYGVQKERVKPDGQDISVGETYQLTTFPLALTLNSCGNYKTSFSLVSGGNPAPPTNSCISKSYMKCYNKTVYYYDSCGNKQDLVMDCVSRGMICDEGTIGYDICKLKCTATTQKTCFNNGVYYLDSCGNPLEEVKHCNTYDEICKNNDCVKKEATKNEEIPENIVNNITIIGVTTAFNPKETSNLCGAAITPTLCGKYYENYVLNEVKLDYDRIVSNPEEAKELAKQLKLGKRFDQDIFINEGATNSFVREFNPTDTRRPDGIGIKIGIKKDLIEQYESKTSLDAFKDEAKIGQFKDYANREKNFNQNGFKTKNKLICFNGCEEGVVLENQGAKWEISKKGSNFVEKYKIKGIGGAITIGIMVDWLFDYSDFSYKESIKECYGGSDSVYTEGLRYYENGAEKSLIITPSNDFSKAIINTKKYCGCKSDFEKLDCCINIINNYYNRNDLIKNKELCVNEIENIDVETESEWRNSIDRTIDNAWQENKENLTFYAPVAMGAVCISTGLIPCATIAGGTIIGDKVLTETGAKKYFLSLRRNLEKIIYKQKIKND